MPAQSAGKLGTVEAGRAIAALLVVLFHASTAFIAAPHYWNRVVFGQAFDFGYAGVEFFFVLSGFIIAHVHAGDIGRPPQLRRYALRRLVRIYPVYWLVLGGVLLLTVLPLGLVRAAPPTTPVLLSSILLAGADSRPSVLVVAWTLYHEVAFYLVFGLWILDRWLGALVSLVWLALVLARLFGVGELGFVPRYLSSEFNLLFPVGILVWWLAERAVMPWPRRVMLLAALAFAAIGYEAVFIRRWPESLEHLGFGLASALGLFAMVSAERAGQLRVPRWLVLFGGASYALYLTHYSLLSLLAKLMVKAGLRDRIPAEVAFFVMVLVVVALGYGFHRLVERPMLWRLQQALGLNRR